MSDYTNSSLCDDYNTNWNTLNQYELWIVGASTIAQIGILAWIELRRIKHKPKIQWKIAFSSFNNLLIVISISLTVNIFFFYAYSQTYDIGLETVYYVLSTIGAFSINIGYFLYVWGRGAPVFTVVAARFVPWIPWYFYPYLLLQTIQAGFYIAAVFIENPFFSLGGYISSIQIFLLQIFEIFVTYCYSRYLWNLKKATELEADASLVILSQFGLASSALGILWLLCDIIYFYYPWDCSVSIVQNSWYFVLDAASFALLVGYVFLQLWMKEALRKQEANANSAVVVRAQKNVSLADTKNHSGAPGKSDN